MATKLTVKQTTVKGRKVFGVFKGSKRQGWYTTKARAQNVAAGNTKWGRNQDKLRKLALKRKRVARGKRKGQFA